MEINNNKGFSLIELMVVVAIIGILSAVAVPQFQKFQRKAKQTEGKAALAAVYTGEKVFLAEFGTYYTALVAIGYEPEGIPLYLVGFKTPATTISSPAGYTSVYLVANSVASTSNHICSTSWAGGYSRNCMYESSTLTSLLAALPASTATVSTFNAAATGKLGGSSLVDTWTIDHRKELINTVNGTL